MTVDREQTRRDALVGWLVKRIDGLLAELEQVERALSDLREQKRARGGMAQKIEDLTRERDEAREKLAIQVRLRAESVARLAKVPALVEALRHVVNDSPGTPDSVKRYLRDALAAYEQEQP